MQTLSRQVFVHLLIVLILEIPVTMGGRESRWLTVVVGRHNLGEGVSHFELTVGDATHVGLGGVERSVYHGAFGSW